MKSFLENSEKRSRSFSIELSIIILNYNTTHLVLDCIRSIYQYPPKAPFEILVVDNGSEESIEPKLNELFPEVRHIETGKNIGFSCANNLGIQNSHGKYILLLNSDTKFIMPTLEDMIGYMESHPQVGILGPRQIKQNGQFDLSCGRFPTLISEFIRKIVTHRLSINDYIVRDYLDAQFTTQSQVDWVSGACMLIARKILPETRLLDEHFFMYFEDIDLCKRTQLLGYEVHFLSHTTLVHYGGESAKLNLMLVLTEYRKSQIYFARKYYSHSGELLIRTFLVLKFLLHPVKWCLIWLINKTKKKDTVHAYTMALLTKKLLMIAISPIPKAAQEPCLYSANASDTDLR